MQDIDFEELDRAVSSVLGETTPKPTVSTSQPTAVETPLSPVPSPTPPLTASPRPIATSAPSAPRPTSGRFMDVVHPSSDMRTVNAVRPSEVSPAVPLASSPSPVINDTPAVRPLSSLQSSPDASVTLPALPQDDILESPFISDAKVEKRPLGAFSASDTSDEALPIEDTKPFLDLTAALNEEHRVLEESETPVQEETAAPAPVPEPIDLEISEEQLAGISETDDTISQPEQNSSLDASQKKVESPTPQPLQEVRVAPSTTSLATASIPQQYTEQPVSSDQQSGAIYDTESYHQPLTYPQKKSGSWLIVLWIVGLILLGGGIGAALYFFVLPQL